MPSSRRLPTPSETPAIAVNRRGGPTEYQVQPYLSDRWQIIRSALAGVYPAGGNYSRPDTLCRNWQGILLVCQVVVW